MKNKILLLFCLSLLNTNISANERIIISGASISQVVADLGLSDRVIGRDRTSKIVQKIKNKKDLGMPSQMNAEFIISMKPDLFLYGSRSENKKLLKQLKTAKVKMIKIDERDSIDNIIEKVDAISTIFSVKKSIVEKLKKNINAQMKLVQKLDKIEKKKAVFIYARGQSNIFMAGAKTPANEIMKIIGIKNAFDSFNGFKPVSIESVILANPDYLIMLKSGVKSLKSIWDIPGMNLTTAGKKKQLIEVETLSFLGFIPDTLPLLISLHGKLKDEK